MNKVKLKKYIISSQSGVSRKLSNEDIGYYVVRSGNIKEGRFVPEPAKYWHLNDDQGIDLKKYILDEGEIMVNFINSIAQIGKAAIFQCIGRQCIFTTNIFRIKLSNEVDSKYFLYYSLSNDYKDFISSITKPAINQASFTRKNFAELELPLAPIHEQKQIVSKLDALFERIDKSIVLLEENIEQTKKLIASSLDGIFHELSASHSLSPLLQYVDFVGGSQPPKINFSNERKDGYVRLIQIRDYKSDNYIVYIKENSTKKFCKADDVMIGRYGPPVFQILRGLEGAYNVALMKAIPDEKVISKDFLFYFLQNGKIQNYIISISQRAAGQSGVNKKALEKYEIVIPPLSIQEKTVAKIKALQNNLSKLQKEQKDKLANLKALKESLLDKAFKGEL